MSESPNCFSVTVASHPILSCGDSAALEARLLDSDRKVWDAMQSVGRQLGKRTIDEYRMSRFPAKDLSVFALVGKGHNGGDALLALAEMAKRGVLGEVTLAVTSSLDELKPNTKRAFDILESLMNEGMLQVLSLGAKGEQRWLEKIADALRSRSYDVFLDGLLGMSFKAPLRSSARGLIERANEARSCRLRVAVDLPSGMGEESDALCFKADVTFATGICKKPLLDRAREESVGCIRYLDLGFFDENSNVRERVVDRSVLDSIRGRRSSGSDKRHFGRLLILAGSRNMPGALLMSVRSALQSGVGLLTVCAPESLVAQLAPQAPEAMWIPWPETPKGGLALEGTYLLRELSFEPDALLIGPGVGSDPETIAMLADVVSHWKKPLVVDADALRPEIVDAVDTPFVATPHRGEFQRLLDKSIDDGSVDEALIEYARKHSGTVLLKGPNTRVSDGEHLFVNTTGNAVLARGGSGDLLAGMVAALLASNNGRPVDVACQAAYWHGAAADELARVSGQVAARTTDLLDMYAPSLMM